MENTTISSVLLFIDTLFNLVLSILLAAYTLATSAFRRHHRLPPGPTPWPVVGSLVTMLRSKSRSRWVLGIAEGNDIACVRLGGVHVVVVSCPELACEFLKKHDASFASRPVNMAGEYVSRGFLSIGLTPMGEQWKKMRRVVASELMNAERLGWAAKLRAEEADHLVTYISRQCTTSEPSPIDIRGAVRYYLGSLTRRLLFGQRHFGAGGENGGPSEEEVEYMDAAFAALSFLNAFRAADFVPGLRWFDLDGHEKAMKEAMRVIDMHHDPIIDERMERCRGTGDHHGSISSTTACMQKQKPQDLLDVMISLVDAEGKPLLTSEEIKAQIAELVYATIDNASNIVEWTLALLLNHRDMMARAVQELDRVIGKDRLVQDSDFTHLTFTKACAREALRLYPSAPFNLPHVCTCDTIVAGYFIPEGSSVLLSRVGLSRNPRIWADPEIFDPDRHLVDGSGSVELAEPGLRFISFSTGRRGCPATQLGTQITYMLLATLLHAFEWNNDSRVSVDLSVEENSGFMEKPLHAFATPRLDI